MKITLIAPPFGSKTGAEMLPIAPPVLAYLAGLTKRIAPEVEIELFDTNRDHVDLSESRAASWLCGAAPQRAQLF